MSGCRWLVAVGCVAVLFACTSSGDGPVGPFLPTGEAGASDGAAGRSGVAGAPASADVCETGCEATLAADCERGPATQASCEADCRALGAGACGAEYAALQSCAQGESISCSAEGFPIVEACADQQAAFIACENG